MDGNHFRVLLIEDNSADAELVSIALAGIRHSRFEISRADRLAKGLNELRAAHYDAVLLNLLLPDGQGLDSIREIRAVSVDTPIIVLTGLNDQATALDALEQGAQDYLVKDELARGTLARALLCAVQRQQIFSERRRVLEELENAKRQLERKNQRLAELYDTAHRFVDNVSHEFRTPLTVIKEYCSIIREGLLGGLNAEQGYHLDIVIHRVDDLATMVNDMLDISKLEAGLLGARRKKCRSEDVLAQVRGMLERKAAIKQVDLQIDVPDDLPLLYCDAEKAGRVLINLAINAIKFVEERGRIRVWARRDDENSQLVVGVTDNGPGISPDNLAVIFERFRQLNGQIRSSTKGFGLGLNIAKELVHLNLGEIDVESELGRGSTFSFSIPYAEPDMVFARYIRRLRYGCETPVSVSLITAIVGPAVTPAEADEADEFLQDILRRNDLLLRIEDGKWLLAAESTHQESQELIKRLQGCWNEANRNRPLGPLVPLQFDVKATYQLEPIESEVLEGKGALMKTSDKRRILLVDDDREIVSGLRLRLKTLGYEVLTAHDGKQGLESAIENQPDLMVLDIRMPVMDGLTTLTKLRERQDTKDVPVIMVSASLVDQKRALDMGARFFLEKPYEPNVLTATIASALNHHPEPAEVAC